MTRGQISRGQISRGQPSSGKTPITARKRADLVAVPTRHRNGTKVVVKDPIAMKYFRLRPDEYFVLEQLTSGTTLESLQKRYEDRFRPEKVSLSELNELLFRFHGMGLTLSDAHQQGERLIEKRDAARKQRRLEFLTSLLFIRFPGVDPEPVLRRLYPIVRPLLSLFGLVLAITVMIAALFILATDLPRFLSELPEMRQWIQLRAILILGAVIGVTKGLHELGHALVCKHFGGECHQIGPMLLVFVPALYCDTSDSWLLPNRLARAAVGLAGIATEVLLASLATLVWFCTGPSLVHYIAMNVMVVCSLSTLLLNANPLLRYDGYYVLSDLFDVPNLGQKSRSVLSAAMAKVCFGVDLGQQEPISTRERYWLMSYAVASVTYRWLLTLLILWLLLVMLRPYRLESVGRLIFVFAAGGILYSTLRGPLAFLRHPGRRRLIRMNRVIRTAFVALLLFAGSLVPLPLGESASGRIVPHNEVPVFATTSGHLDQIHARVGTIVKEGSLLAELTNPDLAFRAAESESRVETQRERVQALKDSRVTLKDTSNELPVAESVLVELHRQMDSHHGRLESLHVRSPVSGRLIAPPRKPPGANPADDDFLTLTSWSGEPTESRNRGCFIEPGTELFSVVADDRWDAELVVSAAQAKRIQIGNAAKLVLDSDPSFAITGTVTEISVKNWDARANGQRRDDERAIDPDAPIESSYAIRVRLDFDGVPPDRMITGANIRAKIESQPVSIAGRVLRSVSHLLRLR